MSQPDLNTAVQSAMQTRPAAIAPAPQTRGQVRAAIAHAARSTGVDFNYLLAQAKLESSLNPNAKAATSSATGLYQFTQGTWQQMLDKHGGSMGLRGSSTEQLMALRNDPQASALMAAHLATDNSAALQRRLGRTPDAGELYMAHFLGAEGAGKFLNALSENSTQSAAALLPKAAASNRNVFFDPSGAPRSVGSVMALMKGRMAAAMGVRSSSESSADNMAIMEEPLAETKLDPWENPELKAAWEDLNGDAAPQAANSGQLAGEFAAAKFQPSNGISGPAAPPAAHTMADTLRSTFGLNGDTTSTPENVRNAYARLKAFGL